MLILWQTILSLCVMFGATAVLLRGRYGVPVVLAVLLLVVWVRQLSWWPLLAALVCLALGLAAEAIINHRLQKNTPVLGVGGLLSTLMLIAVFGIFFSPATSIILWLATTGLQLLPQLGHKKARLSVRAPAVWRCCYAFIFLLLGMYTLYLA